MAYRPARPIRTRPYQHPDVRARIDLGNQPFADVALAWVTRWDALAEQRNLADHAKATAAGNIIGPLFDDDLGVALDLDGDTDALTFSGAPTGTAQDITIAAVIVTDVLTARTFVGTSDTTDTGYRIEYNAGFRFALGGVAASSGITLSAGRPYFVAGSYRASDDAVSLVVRDLLTGDTTTLSGSAAGTPLAGDGTYFIGASNVAPTTGLDGRASMAFTHLRYMDVSQLRAWADDPLQILADPEMRTSEIDPLVTYRPKRTSQDYERHPAIRARVDHSYPFVPSLLWAARYGDLTDQQNMVDRSFAAVNGNPVATAPDDNVGPAIDLDGSGDNITFSGAPAGTSEDITMGVIGVQDAGTTERVLATADTTNTGYVLEMLNGATRITLGGVASSASLAGAAGQPELRMGSYRASDGDVQLMNVNMRNRNFSTLDTSVAGTPLAGDGLWAVGGSTVFTTSMWDGRLSLAFAIPRALSQAELRFLADSILHMYSGWTRTWLVGRGAGVGPVVAPAAPGGGGSPFIILNM